MAYGIRSFNAAFTGIANNPYPEPNESNSSHWHLFVVIQNYDLMLNVEEMNLLYFVAEYAVF